MKRVILTILLLSIVCALFAYDFQGKVYVFKNGPENYRNLEFQFLDDSLLACDIKNGTYTQYPYSVVGGIIFLGELQNQTFIDYLEAETIPYALKDGTAVLELDMGHDKLVLYDNGRKQYRSNLAFGITDKTAVAAALIAGTVYSYEKYNYKKHKDKH